jgi:hypothetical protein
MTTLEERARVARQKAERAEHRARTARMYKVRELINEAMSDVSSYLDDKADEADEDRTPLGNYLAILESTLPIVRTHAAEAAGFETWDAFQAELARIEAEIEAENVAEAAKREAERKGKLRELFPIHGEDA